MLNAHRYASPEYSRPLTKNLRGTLSFSPFIHQAGRSNFTQNPPTKSASSFAQAQPLGADPTYFTLINRPSYATAPTNPRTASAINSNVHNLTPSKSCDSAHLSLSVPLPRAVLPASKAKGDHPSNFNPSWHDPPIRNPGVDPAHEHASSEKIRM